LRDRLPPRLRWLSPRLIRILSLLRIQKKNSVKQVRIVEVEVEQTTERRLIIICFGFVIAFAFAFALVALPFPWVRSVQARAGSWS